MRLEEYNLPDDWEWAKIGDFAKLIRGVSYKKDDASKDSKNGYLPILRANNINNNLIFDDLVYVPSEKIKKEQIIHSGDILISMSSGSKHLVGKTAQACEDYQGSFGAFCGLIRINGEVNKKFVNFFFKSQNYRRIISHLSKGININNLRREYIESMPIPLPPIETQKKIVEILETAEKLKEWRAEADGLANKYLTGVFLEMFGDLYKNEKGWDEYLLNDLIEIPLNSGWSPKCSDETGGIPVFSLANLDGNTLNATITKYYYGESPKKGFDLRNGDILISRSNTRELVGRSGLYKGKPEKVLYPDLMIRIRLNKKVNSVYFEKYLQADSTLKMIRRFAHGTSGSMVKISQKNLGKLKVTLPPLELQNQFAQIVQQIEGIKNYQSQSERQIDNLSNTLMQKAFKGELVC